MARLPEFGNRAVVTDEERPAGLPVAGVLPVLGHIAFVHAAVVVGEDRRDVQPIGAGHAVLTLGAGHGGVFEHQLRGIFEQRQFLAGAGFERRIGADIVLQVLKDLRSDGGTYKSLEYVGSTIDALDMSGRYTIANMSLEAGCKTALFAADQKTADYFDLPLEKISWIHPDPDAHYVRELYYRAEELVPYLSCPQGVDNVHSIEEVQGTPLNEVYIGSCTNGSLEDMAVAARILQGHHVAPYLKLIIIPASIGIYRQCMRLGYIRAFVEAGAMVAHPCCGLCCGQPYGLMSDGEVILGTNNRNFIGRMGTTKSLIYLSSPATAAASALAGVITDPRTVTAD